MSELDKLVEKATATIGEGATRYQMAKKFPTLAVFDLADARAVAEAALMARRDPALTEQDALGRPARPQDARGSRAGPDQLLIPTETEGPLMGDSSEIRHRHDDAKEMLAQAIQALVAAEIQLGVVERSYKGLLATMTPIQSILVVHGEQGERNASDSISSAMSFVKEALHRI